MEGTLLLSGICPNFSHDTWWVYHKENNFKNIFASALRMLTNHHLESGHFPKQSNHPRRGTGQGGAYYIIVVSPTVGGGRWVGVGLGIRTSICIYMPIRSYLLT